MTANEKLIAETAIDQRQAQTYEFIHEEVAKLASISKSEVKNTLDYLRTKPSSSDARLLPALSLRDRFH